MTSIPSSTRASPAHPARTSSPQPPEPGGYRFTFDVGVGDIRAYPPGSHAGVVVLRLTDQSAAAVSKAISDLASLAEPGSLGGAVAVLQRGLFRIRHR